MPDRRQPRQSSLDPEQDELVEMRARWTDLDVNHTELQQRHTQLTQHMSEVVREVKMLRAREPMKCTAGVFLMFDALALAGKLVLRHVVEMDGTAAQGEALASNIILGIAALILLGFWLYADIVESGWLVVPKVIIVGVGLTIAAAQLSEGRLMDGDVHFQPNHPVLVGSAVIVILLFTASKPCMSLIKACWRALNDPGSLFTKEAK